METLKKNLAFSISHDIKVLDQDIHIAILSQLLHGFLLSGMYRHNSDNSH